jgi:hypothetical protein
MCLQGASRAGADILTAIPGDNLRAYFVWVLMLRTDTEGTALTAAERFADLRATHYWDADRHLSRRLAQALAIDTRPSCGPGDDPQFAWDIYLAYRRENADITTPDFWMHQLAIDHAPRLEATEWRRRVTEMLTEGGI